jgi:hypothetical protein
MTLAYYQSLLTLLRQIHRQKSLNVVVVETETAVPGVENCFEGCCFRYYLMMMKALIVLMLIELFLVVEEIFFLMEKW